jgi:hypothetical protein
LDGEPARGVNLPPRHGNSEDLTFVASVEVAAAHWQTRQAVSVCFADASEWCQRMIRGHRAGDETRRGQVGRNLTDENLAEADRQRGEPDKPQGDEGQE